MSEFESSSIEPSYISRLALQSAPFGSAIDSKFYFNGGQPEYKLNLLLHLVRASNKVGVLTSAEGLGKTTLLTELQQRAGEELRICWISATTLLNSHTLLIQCLRDLGDADSSYNENELTDKFKNRLIQLRKLAIRPLLIIDDAQHLSDAVLTDLSLWLGWQHDQDFLLQAIIATSTPTNPLILNGNAHARIQFIDLLPLEKSEIAHYLMHRLKCVGYQGNDLFSDKDIKEFYKQSKGNPARINQLAHQKLLGIQSIGIRQGKKKSGLGVFRWIGLAVLVILFGLLLAYQDKLNQWLTVADQSKKAIQKEELLFPESPVTQIDIDQDNVVSHEQALRNELTDLLAELPVTENDSILPIAPVSPESRVIEPIVDDEVIVGDDVHQNDWVLQQHNTDYTFQLMGSWDRIEVDEFIDKYALSGDIAIVESKRNNRTWYALVYGVFDTKESALAMSKKWPAPLNTLPSWLRRFDSVQKQIKDTAE